MCQLLKSPDLSGDGGEDRRFRPVGEVAGEEEVVEEAGEECFGEEGGEGGSAGRNLCMERIWRMTGRPSPLLVNVCY